MRKEKGRTKIMGGKKENLNKEREIRKKKLVIIIVVIFLYLHGPFYKQCIQLMAEWISVQNP